LPIFTNVDPDYFHLTNPSYITIDRIFWKDHVSIVSFWIS